MLEGDCPGGRLASAIAPPIKIMATFKPAKATESGNGVVFDSGQNSSAMVKLAIRGPAGSTVRLLPSEGPEGGSGGGSYFAYTLKGQGTETWQSQFFYFGLRSIRVEGATRDELAAARKPVVQGLEIQHVRCSAPAAGEFACSNVLINQIHRIILWPIHSNFQSVLTDCPHREKLGWLKVSHLMAPSILFETPRQPSTWRSSATWPGPSSPTAWSPTSRRNTRVFGGAFRDSPEWGSAYVINPWFVYQWYGDPQPLRDHYDGMKRYAAYLASKAKGHILSYGLGDWMPLAATPTPLVATATYFQDITILAKAASVLGKPAEAQAYTALAAEVRKAFNAAFFNPQTSQYGSGSQTSNAMPLLLGLVEDGRAAAVTKNLVADFRKRKNTLTAGDVGNRYVIQGLAKCGQWDVVFDAATQAHSPGYAWQVQRGKTTLTEAWDGGASQNHCMLGHIDKWFYASVLGIQPDPEGPGFRKIIIRPEIVGDLTWAKGHFDSIRGRIASEWKRDGDRLTLTIAIPANTTATVYVPAKDPESVAESGKPAAVAEGVKFLRMEKDRAAFEVVWAIRVRLNHG